MKIDKDWTLPTDPATAFAAITDPAFLARIAEAMSAINHTVSVQPHGERVVVRIERAMPTGQIPSAFRSMVGDRIQVVETQTWGAPGPDGSRTADLAVDLAGVPVRYTGTMTLAGSAKDSTRMTIAGDLKASIPLVGGNIEKAAAPALSSALDVEARESIAWVQSH